MKLSPLLIKKQEFEKSMRGYNIEEVQAFLDKISADFEELINQNENLENEVERLTHELDEFHKIEKKLQDNILRTQETSAHSLESAKAEALKIVKDAEEKAKQLIQKAEEKVDALQNALMTLREEKDLIIAKLRAIVRTQSNLLEGKVQDAGEEPKKTKAPDEPEKLDIDLDGIVDKLL